MNFLFHYMARWKAINWTRYHHIFNHLARMGHTVHVLQPPPANLMETNFQEIEASLPENLNLIDVQVNQTLWNLNFPLNKLIKKGYYSLASREMVKDVVKRYNIDVLFLYNIPQYPLMDGVSCLKIFDYADDYIPMLRHELGRFSNPLALGYAENILRRMVRQSDLTLAVSNVLAESIQGDGVNVQVVPNGVDLRDFSQNEPVTLASLDRTRPVVGFIGAFEYFIDFDLIIGIAQKLPECTFLLVGSGRELPRVRAQVEQLRLKNVVLTGGVPHSQISRYIAAMDVCLNIFKKIEVSHSACPIKLFEYLAMKKPVISTRLKEVERIDEYFILYADTVDECVRAIKMLVENKSTAVNYAQRGFDIILQKYSWGKAVELLLNLIEEAKVKKKSEVVH